MPRNAFQNASTALHFTAAPGHALYVGLSLSNCSSCQSVSEISTFHVPRKLVPYIRIGVNKVIVMLDKSSGSSVPLCMCLLKYGGMESHEVVPARQTFAAWHAVCIASGEKKKL